MNQKILIIGSGPAGIAAATKLLEFGYENVKILEAENRIGGRICTISFGENVLDLGAQWCHGEKGNVVYEIAKKYQNDIFDSTGDLYKNLFNCVKSNREVISNEISIKLNKIIKLCTQSDEAEEELSKFKGSYDDFLNKRFYNELEKSENSDIDKKLAKQFLDFYKKFECSIDACDTLADLSASGLLSYWECEGDPLLNWKGKGYVTILKILMNATEDKPYGILENKIILNKKVDEICWKQNDEGKICVRCEDGEKIDADHVISTVSLGVLKEKHSTLFNPVLPPLKIRAIEGLSIGNVDKMFIEFSKPFWPEGWPGMCLLWEDDDLQLIRSRHDSWIEDVFGFYPVDFQPNILCGWIVGANGRRMELASDEEVLNGLLYLLEKFLSWDISKPKNFVRSTWYKNPNFRGSYSFRSMKTEELNTSAADLAYPLTNDNGIPVLQFAGEATHDHYYSTVHGAIESGWREANRLNDFHINERNLRNCTKSLNTNSVINNDDKNNKNCHNGYNYHDNKYQYHQNTNIYDICILGAGLAGLGAGYYLKQYQKQQNNSSLSSSSSKNFNFIILEAQNYIGGRIKTVEMLNTKALNNEITNNIRNSSNTNAKDNNNHSILNNDKKEQQKYLIDSGAQWLHGKNNQLYKIASKFDLLRIELSEEGLGSYICDNGIIVDDFLRKKVDFKIGQILEECEKLIKINNQTENEIKTIDKYLKIKFYEYLNDPNNEFIYDKFKYDIALRLLDWHIRFQIIDNSCLNLNQLSTKLWGMYSLDDVDKVDDDDDISSCIQAHINFKNGFSSIIYNGILNYISEDNIHLNCEITNINWNILSSTTRNNRRNLIRIETKDNRIYYAKHVIITFSIGVLKLNENNLFTPKLPNSIDNVINSFGFETINKIFLQFDEEWWKPMEGIQLLFSDNDYENSKWTRYLSGFDILYPGTPNTLLGWVGSYGAIKMEKLTDEEIIKDCIELLEKFTKRKVPYPIRYYCSRWNSNKFIRGGYSFLSTKCEELNVTGKNLSIPITVNDLKIINKKNENQKNIEDNIKNMTLHDDSDKNDDCDDNYPIILFAGEACHEKYFSTAHGAFESGYEQAQKLLKYYCFNEQ